MASADTVTGTTTRVSPKRGTVPRWSLTPLAKSWPRSSRFTDTPSKSSAMSFGLRKPQLHRHAHFQAFAGQRVDAGQVDLQRVGAGPRSTSAQRKQQARRQQSRQQSQHRSSVAGWWFWLHWKACGCSSMAERQLPKLHTRVRFPSPAPEQPKVHMGSLRILWEVLVLLCHRRSLALALPQQGIARVGRPVCS